MSYITKEFAYELLEKNRTPKHVILHCMAVARTSVIIAQELNKVGFNLSIEIIEGAAMIHDIARVEEKHEEVGACIAESQGFADEALIIKKHMHYSINPSLAQLKEIDIVCLGDRMVKEDQYVGLKRRMDYILEKWKGDAKAEIIIRARIEESIVLVREIEDLIGTKIEDLINEKGFKE